jgi:hypothetical protein
MPLVWVSGRKTPAFPVAVLQPAPFEFRGIRIGDEIKEAEQPNEGFFPGKYPRFLRNPACAVPMASIGSKLALMFWIPGST